MGKAAGKNPDRLEFLSLIEFILDYFSFFLGFASQGDIHQHDPPLDYSSVLVSIRLDVRPNPQAGSFVACERQFNALFFSGFASLYASRQKTVPVIRRQEWTDT